MRRFYTIMMMLLCVLFANAQERYVGGDISNLPVHESDNTKYLDAQGKRIPDLIQYFAKECGWNTFRVRLFVNPTGLGNDETTPDKMVAQDMAFVKKLAKRIKAVGANFMLDIHYSDTWADPGHQITPASWKKFTTATQKADTVYAYTKAVLDSLISNGTPPDFVQVGNEITGSIMEVSRNDNPAGFKKIVESGCSAVREKCPAAKIVIHIENLAWTSNVVSFFNALNQDKYDIIGLSYYPFWHGYLTRSQAASYGCDFDDSDMSTTLNALKVSFPKKKVQIVEAAYYHEEKDWPKDGIKYDTRSIWPSTGMGQCTFLKDLIAELKTHSNVNGLLYWWPEETGGRGFWCTREGNGCVPVYKLQAPYIMKSFLAL